MNPYKILGVPPTASKDEIDSAYQRIVDTYNLNNLTDSDEYYLIEDKISEANDAYNTLINNLKYKEIRNLIENEEFISAETELNLISDKNNPEWNYLKGFVMLKKGWVQSGVNHLKAATELNPNNPEYKETMMLLSKKINAMKQNYMMAAAANNAARNQQGNMNMCGGGPGGGNMCNDSSMGNLGNMMSSGNPLASMMGGNNPTQNQNNNNNNNMNNTTPNNINSNPLQNMLLQSMLSGNNNMNMCGNGGNGGKMC